MNPATKIEASASETIAPVYARLVAATTYRKWQAVVLMLLIVVKLAISAWNATQFSVNDQYDPQMHTARIATCGLYTTARYYNPPAYYAIPCPLLLTSLALRIDIGSDVIDPLLSGEAIGKVTSRISKIIDPYAVVGETAAPFLQGLNVVMLIAVYWLWAFRLYPTLLPNPDTAFCASLLLLALPGFQRLAVMTHPDNLLLFMTTAAFAYWLFMFQQAVSKRHLLVLALLLGVLGLTRPFAVVPLACLSGVVVLMLWREHGPSSAVLSRAARVGARAAPFLLIIIALSGSWWVYRHFTVENTLSVWSEDSSYDAKFQERKPGFDYVEYFSTFHVSKLLETPNRRFVSDPGVGHDWKHSRSNSFFTLLFSDFWGDHWLYFSGPEREDHKIFFKRLLFFYALPLSVAFLFALLWGSIRVLTAAWRGPWPLEWLCIAGIVWLGLVTFIGYQATLGLEPGKNSSIKFIYIAYLVPFAAALIAKSGIVERMPAAVSYAVLGTLILLCLPLSIYGY